MDYIPLSNAIGVAVVDDDDYDTLCKYRWSLSSVGYVQARVNGVTMSMHRVIMGISPDGLEVDHINGVKQDNRRANLRFVTRSENARNVHDRKPRRPNSKRRTPPVYARGYSWNKRSRKWQGQISVNNTRISLGYFDTEGEAREAYDVYRRQHGLM